MAFFKRLGRAYSKVLRSASPAAILAHEYGTKKRKDSDRPPRPLARAVAKTYGPASAPTLGLIKATGMAESLRAHVQRKTARSLNPRVR